MGTADSDGDATDRQTAIRWMLRDLQALERMLATGLRDRRHAHRRRAGDVPRRRLVAAGAGRAGRCSPTLDRPALHDRGRRLQPRAQPRPAGVRRRLPQPSCTPSSTSCSPSAASAAEAAGLHIVLTGIAADHPQARPLARQHGPEPALPRAQQRADGPARRGLRAAHQGHRRAARAPGLGDGRGVQRQLPGPPPGDARRVRQRSTTSPRCSPARCSRRATNSPLLFGKRLWAETRIALFEQAVDTRRPGHHLRERSARVTFGTTG